MYYGAINLLTHEVHLQDGEAGDGEHTVRSRPFTDAGGESASLYRYSPTFGVRGAAMGNDAGTQTSRTPPVQPAAGSARPRSWPAAVGVPRRRDGRQSQPPTVPGLAP